MPRATWLSIEYNHSQAGKAAFESAANELQDNPAR
jgi:hypothetical protein